MPRTAETQTAMNLGTTQIIQGNTLHLPIVPFVRIRYGAHYGKRFTSPNHVIIGPHNEVVYSPSVSDADFDIIPLQWFPLESSPWPRRRAR
jgi:hypothetical protein